jgi:hypothetical protein
LAKSGDARALLAIPDARHDIPRLLDGRRFSQPMAQEIAWWAKPATEFATRKTITAAKAIVAERKERRAAKGVADAARLGEPGRILRRLATKKEAAARKRKEAAAKREAKIGEATKEAFRPSFKAAGFRFAAHDSSWRIQFGAAAIRSDTEEGWIDYKRQGWRRGIKSHEITVTIPLRWDLRVGNRNLGIVDGLLTLDAEPVKGAPEGIELYQARWARQARGLSIDSQSGIIARHTASATTYHSTTTRCVSLPRGGVSHEYDPKAAVAGLKRKLTAQGVPADVRHARAQAASQARAANRARQLTRLVDRLTAWDFDEIKHVVVRRDHSLKAGNCEPGTDEFIDRFFPDRGRDSQATIGEIASRIGATDPAKLAGADLTLARQLAAACLVAIRRDKQSRRALAV